MEPEPSSEAIGCSMRVWESGVLYEERSMQEESGGERQLASTSLRVKGCSSQLDPTQVQKVGVDTDSASAEFMVQIFTFSRY